MDRIAREPTLVATGDGYVSRLAMLSCSVYTAIVWVIVWVIV